MMACGQTQGPDFLVIGAQRAGTTWIHRVLLKHPALWLPPVKELHYFDKLQRTRTWLDPRERRRLRPKVDLWHLKYLFGKRSDKWYAGLFQKARDRGFIVGEVTPTYALLGEDVLLRIRRMNRDVKLIFVMRDPMDRIWSELNNDVRKGFVTGALTPALALQWMRRRLGIVESSAYLDTVARLEAAFPSTQLHFCFFDDLEARPKQFAFDLLSFLGTESAVVADSLPGPVNVASGESEIPDAFARVIAEEYLPMVIQLCDRFDGAPQRWRSRYEKLLASHPGQVDLD